MSWNECVQGGGSRLLYQAMICRQCEAVAASAFTAPAMKIRSAQRCSAEIVMARATTIHLAATGFGLPNPAFDMILTCLDHGLRIKIIAILEDIRAISTMGARP